MNKADRGDIDRSVDKTGLNQKATKLCPEKDNRVYAIVWPGVSHRIGPAAHNGKGIPLSREMQLRFNPISRSQNTSAYNADLLWHAGPRILELCNAPIGSSKKVQQGDVGPNF